MSKTRFKPLSIDGIIEYDGERGRSVCVFTLGSASLEISEDSDRWGEFFRRQLVISGEPVDVAFFDGKTMVQALDAKTVSSNEKRLKDASKTLEEQKRALEESQHYFNLFIKTLKATSGQNEVKLSNKLSEIMAISVERLKPVPPKVRRMSIRRGK